MIGDGLGFPLKLSPDVLASLEALEAFALRISATESVAAGEVTRGDWIGERMFAASAAVLAAALPECPYPPPGAAVEPRWSTGSRPRMIVRCKHDANDDGPHCWDRMGNPTEC